MAQQAWDQKLTDFLKAAGEELRRTGEELKAETQKLLDEVTDADVQAKMKERIHQLGKMAKKTAAEAASKLQATFGGKPKKARKAARSASTSRKPKRGAGAKSKPKSAKRKR